MFNFLQDHQSSASVPGSSQLCFNVKFPCVQIIVDFAAVGPIRRQGQGLLYSDTAQAAGPHNKVNSETNCGLHKQLVRAELTSWLMFISRDISGVVTVTTDSVLVELASRSCSWSQVGFLQRCTTLLNVHLMNADYIVLCCWGSGSCACRFQKIVQPVF